MPCTYVNAREKPRDTLTFSPWPTMMPDRMGIIGNTQGVRERSKPKPKKVPRTRSKLPSRISIAKRSCSDVMPVEPDDEDFPSNVLAFSVGGSVNVVNLVIGL